LTFPITETLLLRNITLIFPYFIGYIIGGESLLSEVPADLEETRTEYLDKEILRAAMIAELDAINIYEQMANMAKSKKIRKILLDIARKEKIHVAMFETVLLQTDKGVLKIYADYALARSRKQVSFSPFFWIFSLFSLLLPLTN
jgi:hypothetical protein